MNLLDRAISYILPAAGASRARARLRADSAARATMIYEGAARSQRSGFRRVGGTSANTEILYSLQRLRDVSRDLVRNNALAASIIAKIGSNIVGAGVECELVGGAQRRRKAMQDLLDAHLGTTAIDFDGRNNLSGLQGLAARVTPQDGEALLVRYVPPASLKLPVPLQIRALEADYLDPSKTGPVAGGGYCYQGIEFDAQGRRVAYWLFDDHPGGGLQWKLPQSRRVPERDVIHMYRVDRPGQARGVPWLAPVIVTLWDLADYEDAELMRQKIAACFAVFYTGGEDTPPAGTGASASEASLAGTPIETVEPGMIKRLPDGGDVKFAQPPLTAGFTDYTRGHARKACMGTGVPYEVGTGDMSQVSFISGRLGTLQFNRDLDQWRWHMLIPQACDRIGQWFVEACDIALGGRSGVTTSWTPPRREMVDPSVEVPAMRDLVRSGHGSRSQNVRQLGFDPEKVEDEIQTENQRADTKQLRFDSDGRFPINTRGVENIGLPPGAPEQPPALPGQPAAPAPKGKPNGALHA